MPTAKRRRYITDQTGKRVGVILNIKTFEQIEDELDELACIRAYDNAKPETDAAIRRGDFVTLDEILAERKSKKELKRNGRVRRTTVGA